MLLVRSLAVYLLVLTLLPWGAYSTAKAAQQPLLALQVLSIADHCQDADTASAQPTQSRLAALPHQCRTGILVGSSCGADPAVFASAPAPDMTRALHIQFLHTVARFVSVVPTRMLDPPRAC